VLGNIIFVILFIILAEELFRNIKTGIIIYLVFSLISPHLKVGNLQISFEIMSFFLVLGIYLLKKPSVFSIYQKYLYRQHLMVYFFLFIIVSLLATSRFGSTIPWLSFMAIFRVICIIYILQYAMKGNQDKVLDKILSPVLIVNLIASIIQLTVPDSTKIFYDLYYKDSMVPLEATLELGYFNRAYGTFGTPVLLGVFSLLSFATYFGFLIERKNCKHLYFKLISSIIIGLLALSKTAIIGIPIILLLSCILILCGIIKVKNKKIWIFPLVLIPSFMVTVQLLERQGTAISWYLAFLTKPSEALITRYDSTSGNLSDTYSTIANNWLLGVGGTSLFGDFMGDSMYIGILYSTGVLGFLVYFSTLFGSALKNLKLRNITALLSLIAICLSGLGVPIHLDIISVSFLTYMFSISEAQKEDCS
jgi:hypothetical protein